jgi:hypothetical protein
MDNVLIMHEREYMLEKVWDDGSGNKTLDSKGKRFPQPVEGVGWPDMRTFIGKLTNLNDYIDLKKKYKMYDQSRKCLICGAKNITTKWYIYNGVIWEDGLLHYIEQHNIEPSVEFKKFIFGQKFKNLDIGSKKKDKMILSRIKKNNTEYVMIDRNQLLILDALMIHGGYVKRYADMKKNLSRYSEHAGILDFENNVLTKIVVSGNTNRVDVEDNDIYLPIDMDEMFEYEYIFHTHPPTPRPGGRAVDGILYEFPSISDIYHFIDHHNEGNVIGSLVITPEGLYNIRKSDSQSKANIEIDEDKLYKNYQKIFRKIQTDAIHKYGTKFNTNMFYTKIAQDYTSITAMNSVLNEFSVHIDYYPRQKDKYGKWYIDTLFLVFRKNKTKK